MNWKIFDDKQPLKEKTILEQISAFDEKNQKTLVHVRLNNQTAMTLKQLKLATGLDIQQMIAFSVSEMLRQHPELKIILKQFLQKLNE